MSVVKRPHISFFQSYDEDAEDAEDHPMPNPVESILGIFLMSLGLVHKPIIFCPVHLSDLDAISDMILGLCSSNKKLSN